MSTGRSGWGLPDTELTLRATGPVVHSEAITTLHMEGGTFDMGTYTPDVSIDTMEYRPWDTERCIIALMIPVAAVTWAVLKFVL